MINVDITHQIVSIVFVCHADSGKSTVLCSLLYNLGQVDESNRKIQTRSKSK